MMITLVIALFIYFCLPLSLIFIPEVMNQSSPVLNISWAWLYAFIQIPMTWFFCGLYHFTAIKFEQQMDGVKQEELL